MSAASERPLRILHVLRAPVGGLFRHVVDLAAAQAARGHRVGILADSITGGGRADEILSRLGPELALGIDRIPMDRVPSRRDLRAIKLTAKRAKTVRADIVHGHGAKGGLYARLAGGRSLKVYTPHGGTLHFSNRSPGGFAYLRTEWLLRFRTDVALFESEYARDAFARKIGGLPRIARVVHNGISAGEFDPVLPAPDAADFVFIGELSLRKGIGTLLDALALLSRKGRAARLVIVGSGRDEGELHARVQRLGLEAQVRFLPQMPAREAFALARVMVMPSHAESLPYIVLEALAAGLPIICTDVGGIPEIFGPYADVLVPPDDAPALAEAMAVDHGTLIARTMRLRVRVRSSFSVEVMCEGVLGAYADGLAARS